MNNFATPKWVHISIRSAGGVLLAIALNGIIAVMGNAQILSVLEPVLGIKTYYVAILAIACELAVCGICLFGKRFRLQVLCLATVATALFSYQIVLLLNNFDRKLTIVGLLSDPLRLAHTPLRLIPDFVPIYLLLVSCAFGFRLLFFKRQSRQQEHKILCYLK